MSRLRVSRRENRVERIEISPSVPLLNVLRADLAVRKGRMVDLDIDFTSKVYYLLRVCYSFHGDPIFIFFSPVFQHDTNISENFRLNIIYLKKKKRNVKERFDF